MAYKLITPELFKEYSKIEIPFKDFNEFFDQYADGKREGNGVVSKTITSGEAILFWLENEEYPFAYTFTKENGIFFYLRC